MAGLFTNPMAQSQQSAAQQAGLESQIGQQALMDKVLSAMNSLSQNPSAQNANMAYMEGSPTGGSGGLYGNLAAEMNGVAGSVPGLAGSMNQGVLNNVLGEFQQPVTSGASTLYYNALKNALGVNAPTVGSQNQMILGGSALGSFANSAGNTMGSVLASGGGGGETGYVPGSNPAVDNLFSLSPTPRM